MKYIVMILDGEESIFLFPRTVDHDRFAEGMEAIRFGGNQDWKRKLRGGEIVSAGFVDGGNCYGHSETLNLESRGEADTELLYQYFDKPVLSTPKSREMQLEISRRAATITDTSSMTGFDSSMTREQIAKKMSQIIEK
jgi:hypothetical protein